MTIREYLFSLLRAYARRVITAEHVEKAAWRLGPLIHPLKCTGVRVRPLLVSILPSLHARTYSVMVTFSDNWGPTGQITFLINVEDGKVKENINIIDYAPTHEEKSKIHRIIDKAINTEV